MKLLVFLEPKNGGDKRDKMKYFLKAPWQSERKEVTREQFIKAKLDFMATSCHLQYPSFVPTQFRSKHGVEGWVEKDRPPIRKLP